MSDVLIVADVAAELQVTVWTVRTYLRTGKLKGVHLGGDGHWRVHRRDLDAFLAVPAAERRRTPRPRPITGRFARQVRGLG